MIVSFRDRETECICFRWSHRGPEDVEIVDYHS